MFKTDREMVRRAAGQSEGIALRLGLTFISVARVTI